ncbi:interferon alpha-inducible protein 27-like protein 2A isoform X1 [Poecilia latipinna]|uniref:interferon alpha-inducible protein 27-like protein 2A isoform X1 n=1 Tax=Poecilia latipinna TaxID=48699 RepID=UPI00072DFF3E|nr:PREDICTED: interferon alpha-inducible protein 27-like protein 2A isoform X1 [Poecilia latipinna]
MGVAQTAAITGGAVGAVGIVLMAPVALSAIGFTSAGIAAGSYAAKMMSAAATANGGGVAAGSLVAILQSAGASGFTASANTVLASIGSALGTCVGAAVGWLSNIFQKRNEQKRREEAMAVVLFGIAAGALFMWSKH